MRIHERVQVLARRKRASSVYCILVRRLGHGASDDLSRRSYTDARTSAGAGTGTAEVVVGIGEWRSTKLRRSWDHLPRVERDGGDLLGRESRRECTFLSNHCALGGKIHLVLLKIAMPAPAGAPQAVGSNCLRLCHNLEERGRPSTSAKPELATNRVIKIPTVHIDDVFCALTLSRTAPHFMSTRWEQHMMQCKRKPNLFYP